MCPLGSFRNAFDHIQRDNVNKAVHFVKRIIKSNIFRCIYSDFRADTIKKRMKIIVKSETLLRHERGICTKNLQHYTNPLIYTV